MKTLMRWIIVAGMLSGSSAHAQGVTGTWQGTLNPGKELRIVLTISSAAAGTLTAVMCTIDQGGQGIAANPVTFQGATLRFEIGAIGGTYEGQLSANGNSLVGTGRGREEPAADAGASYARHSMADSVASKPMAADASAVFEVATIKPSNPDTPGKVFTVRGRQILTINTTLNDLISFASPPPRRTNYGRTRWSESVKCDITAQPEAQGQPNESQLRAMFQKLLEDRFRLMFHRDKKELPVYALVVGKTGHRLTVNDRNPNGLPSLMFKGSGCCLCSTRRWRNSRACCKRPCWTGRWLTEPHSLAVSTSISRGRRTSRSSAVWA